MALLPITVVPPHFLVCAGIGTSIGI